MTAAGRYAGRVKPVSTVWSFVRGLLVGGAEALPGISGGTIALVTGVYETAIEGAGHVVSGTRRVFSDRKRAAQEFREVNWWVITPLLMGMIPGLLLTAKFLAPALEENPIPLMATFLGMTMAAVIVPITMVGGRWTGREVLIATGVAVIMFFVVGLPPQQLEPTPPVIFLAAAIAICALALPGTSGSFFLLTMGLYQPSLEALNDRDLGYIAVFGLGAVIGLALFVRGLQWLLEHRHRITLVILTGVVLGALRALWPWQDDDRTLRTPGEQIPQAAMMFVIGALLVLGLFVFSRRLQAKLAEPIPSLDELSDPE